MTYKELPEYCYTHMCKEFCDAEINNKCEYEALCTRFYRKYGCTPHDYLMSGRGRTEGEDE